MAKKYKPAPKHIPRTSIKSLRNLKQYRKQLIDAKSATDAIASFLLREGSFIITSAYHTRGFSNRTHNLHDSYVAAVFVNGKLYGKHFVGEAESNDPDRKTGTTGREEAERFLDLISAEINRTGVQLVIAAAMYYSGIVENRGYSVLASVSGEVEDLISRKFDVSSYLAHISLDEISEPSIYRAWTKGQGLGDMQIVQY